MGTSISTNNEAHGLTFVSWIALACAALAAIILLWYLVRRPPELTWSTKLVLLLGFGVLPFGASFTGNLVGYSRTMERTFCGRCHTMRPYTADSDDPTSTTLAAIHSRNKEFGEENCYRCHEDYGMFGTVVTKASGMKHLWHYYTRYRSVPLEESLGKIKLYKPYPNGNCMQCHSTQLPGWNDIPEHASSAELVRSGEVSCASAGCHGPAHPFSKPKGAGTVTAGVAP